MKAYVNCKIQLGATIKQFSVNQVKTAKTRPGRSEEVLLGWRRAKQGRQSKKGIFNINIEYYTPDGTK